MKTYMVKDAYTSFDLEDKKIKMPEGISVVFVIDNYDQALEFVDGNEDRLLEIEYTEEK